MLRIVLLIAACLAIQPARATEAGWAQLREGGQVVLVRNANIAGAGDRDVDDCSSQRNLSSRGEQQARRMGALFAARAARTERVYTSRLCSSFDTARIAFGASLVEPFEALDSSPAETEGKANAAIMEEIRGFSGSGNLVMVTDQAKIEALTGFSPREAEAVVVVPEGDGLHVTGRILFN